MPDGDFENLQADDYEVIVQDANGCETVFVANIAPASPLELSLDVTLSIEAGDSVKLQPVLNILASEVASVTWSPAEGLSCSDCLTPIASPNSDAVYTVQITNLDGCSVTASVAISVTVVVPTGDVFVPNAFTPDGDGINDVFMVFADEKQVKEITSFQVFSRWGEAVYQGFGLRPNDLTTGWGGTHRGKDVDPGVFVWFAEVELVTGEKKLLKGDVAVLR